MQKSEKKPSATYLMNELTKLKTQLKYLEATQMTLKPVSHLPSELNELNELECLKIEQDLNLVTLEDKLKHDAFRLHDLVKDVRCEMLSVDGLCKFNTKQYRERIEVIDQLQRELESKNAQQLNTLKSEYCQIEDELLPLMNNLDLMQKTPTIKNRINAISMRRIIDIAFFCQYLHHFSSKSFPQVCDVHNQLRSIKVTVTMYAVSIDT